MGSIEKIPPAIYAFTGYDEGSLCLCGEDEEVTISNRYNSNKDSLLLNPCHCIISTTERSYSLQDGDVRGRYSELKLPKERIVELGVLQKRVQAKVYATLNGRRITALVDTGAQFSVINHKMLVWMKQEGMMPELIQPTIGRMQGIGGVASILALCKWRIKNYVRCLRSYCK